MNVNNVTVTENVTHGQCGHARDCAAVVTSVYASTPVAGFQNSIIAGNRGSHPEFRGISCSTPIESRGDNVVGSRRDCGFGAATLDATAVSDPQLQPLAAPAGNTPPGHSPEPAGMAVDAGNPSGCTYRSVPDGGPPDSVLTRDQFGQVRPVGAACDAGAIELQNWPAVER